MVNEKAQFLSMASPVAFLCVLIFNIWPLHNKKHPNSSQQLWSFKDVIDTSYYSASDSFNLPNGSLNIRIVISGHYHGRKAQLYYEFEKLDLDENLEGHCKGRQIQL